jgi:hypothetical protein
MAGVIYTDAISVIKSDTINIPEPGIIISGTNTTAGTTLTDVGAGFLNSTTNPKGFNINGGDVVVDSAGAIVEVEEVLTDDTIKLKSAIALGAYEIYKGNYNVTGKSEGFSLYVGTGGGGDIKATTVFGNDITISAVANQTLDLQVIKVFATGTTASNIIALKIQD